MEADVDDFDGDRLGPQWSTLRRPATADWVTLAARPSHLRIRGGRSPQSLLGASLVARRLTAPRAGFEATVDYRPTVFQYAAGILDATILSDEHAADYDSDGRIRALGFTGAFVGLWVWDLTGRGHAADFDAATFTTV